MKSTTQLRGIDTSTSSSAETVRVTPGSETSTSSRLNVDKLSPKNVVRKLSKSVKRKPKKELAPLNTTVAPSLQNRPLTESLTGISAQNTLGSGRSSTKSASFLSRLSPRIISRSSTPNYATETMAMVDSYLSEMNTLNKRYRVILVSLRDACRQHQSRQPVSGPEDVEKDEFAPRSPKYLLGSQVHELIRQRQAIQATYILRKQEVRKLLKTLVHPGIPERISQLERHIATFREVNGEYKALKVHEVFNLPVTEVFKSERNLFLDDPQRGHQLSTLSVPGDPSAPSSYSPNGNPLMIQQAQEDSTYGPTGKSTSSRNSKLVEVSLSPAMLDRSTVMTNKKDMDSLYGTKAVPVQPIDPSIGPSKATVKSWNQPGQINPTQEALGSALLLEKDSEHLLRQGLGSIHTAIDIGKATAGELEADREKIARVNKGLDENMGELEYSNHLIKQFVKRLYTDRIFIILCLLLILLIVAIVVLAVWKPGVLKKVDEVVP